ncbi:MAG: divalent cation tolerance protein CutA [Bacteroidia bacterium]|nr:divalent cation tolerance protein CutA [Bacteroidia bacterium]
MSAIVVVTTAGTEEEANLLAEELVERRHSCCVNILPIQRSVYRWQGKICDDSEYMLIIKTLESEYSAVEEAVAARGFAVEIGGSLYSDSLGNPGTPAGSYEGTVRANVGTIVSALAGDREAE